MTESSRVLVVGPNPAMDIILEVPHFTPDASQRATASLHVAGGKPVNVARTLRRLGISVSLAAPLGGRLGPASLITDTCAELGIELLSSPIEQETRTCIVIADPDTGESTVVNERGPQLSGGESREYAGLVREALTHAPIIVCSGSLPPGLPATFYADLVSDARKVGSRVIVDSSGEALREALRAAPWAVKVNRDELLAVTTEPSVDDAARNLAQTVEHVVVTLGPEGALYVGPDGLYRVPVLPTTVINPTGAGDAFLAGLVAGLARGDCWPHALALATAAAALAVSRFAPDIGVNPNLADLLRQVHVSGEPAAR